MNVQEERLKQKILLDSSILLWLWTEIHPNNIAYWLKYFIKWKPETLETTCKFLTWQVMTSVNLQGVKQQKENKVCWIRKTIKRLRRNLFINSKDGIYSQNCQYYIIWLLLDLAFVCSLCLKFCLYKKLSNFKRM